MDNAPAFNQSIINMNLCMIGYRIREREWKVGNCHFCIRILWMLAMVVMIKEDESFTDPPLYVDSLKCNYNIALKTVLLCTTAS